MKTYQLTQHFALNEFTRSATAIANGIDNNLDLAKADDRMVAENLQYLCQTILETQGSRQWIHVSTCRNDSRNRQTCMTLKR